MKKKENEFQKILNDFLQRCNAEFQLGKTELDIEAFSNKIEISIWEILIFFSPDLKEDYLHLKSFISDFDHFLYNWFVSIFGSEKISYKNYTLNDYITYLAKRTENQKAILAAKRRSYLPSKTFCLHTGCGFTSETHIPFFYFMYFPPDSHRPNYTFKEANDAINAYEKFKHCHKLGFISVFSQTYLIPVTKERKERILRSGYKSLQEFKEIEAIQIQTLGKLCEKKGVQLWINESESFDVIAFNEPSPWKRLC